MEQLLEEQRRNGHIVVSVHHESSVDEFRNLLRHLTPEAFPIIRQIIRAHILLVNEKVVPYKRLFNLLGVLMGKSIIELYPHVIQIVIAIKDNMKAYNRTTIDYNFPVEFIRAAVDKYHLAFIRLLYECKFDLHDIYVPIFKMAIELHDADLCTYSINGIINSSHSYGGNPDIDEGYAIYLEMMKYVDLAIDAGNSDILDLIIRHVPYPRNEKIVTSDIFTMLLYRTEPDSVRLPIIETLYTRGAFRSIVSASHATRDMFADVPDSRASNRLIEIIIGTNDIQPEYVIRTSQAA